MRHTKHITLNRLCIRPAQYPNDHVRGVEWIPLCCLHPADRHFTTFITPWGRYRYRTAPQGYIVSGDGYTRRYYEIVSLIERKTKCIDDTLLWSTDIRSWFGLINQVAYALTSYPSAQTHHHVRMDGLPTAGLQTRHHCHGVTIFDKEKPTCLATDWSKHGIKYWLFQKHCQCQFLRPLLLQGGMEDHSSREQVHACSGIPICPHRRHWLWLTPSTRPATLFWIARISPSP